MKPAVRFLYLGVALSACSVASANLLVNGNLDDTYQQEIVPAFFLPKPTAWQNVGTRSISGPYEDEMSSEPWAGPAPTPVTTGTNASFPAGPGLDAGVFFKAFSGNATDGSATGHLFQDVAGTAGLTYVFTGWAGGEANVLMAGAEMALEFRNAAGGLLNTATLNLLPTLVTPNGQPFQYKFYTLNGLAPAGTASVRARISMLGGMPNPQGGGQAYVVDDFELTAVPEPATIAVLGLGAAALLRRRRKQA